jgi:hypothetical protein
MSSSELGHLQHLSQSAWQQLHQAITNLCPQQFSVTEREQLTWKYLVLIDRSSYSRQFCIADTAWESDLEGWQQKQWH